MVGLTLTQAEQQIRRLSVQREIYREPHVAVLMKQRRMIRVRVVGAVDVPGVYELPAAGSDLLAALVAAGGLNEKAGTVIEIRHPNAARPLAQGGGPRGRDVGLLCGIPGSPHRTVRVDLREPSAVASELDLHVEDGSVVVVLEKTKRSISVIGLVRRPDNYELPTDETLRVLGRHRAGRWTECLGGQPGSRHSPCARPGGTDRDRRVPEEAAKRDGRENLVLAAGDIVSVEETPTTFLVETVRGFLRFGFSSAIPGI